MTRRNCLGYAFLPAIAAVLWVGGCSVYVQSNQSPPPAPAVAETETVYQPPPADVITTYQTDLNPYGHWVTVASYGQCWVPNDCPAGWRPYTVGHWVYSDDGWTWVSDDTEADWGPVVYHYGCWYQSSGYGWCWVPGTTWAPAWVAWREGGGYCGWAPLPPQVAFDSNISPAAVDQYCPANQYTYCSEQYINAPRVDQHIVQNNVTIINQTTNITNITYHNNRVVNQGVAVADVEHATGRPVEKVAIATATTPQEARQLVAAGKPVMYAPPALKQAQSQRAAAGQAKIANPQPLATESKPENTPEHSPEAVQENRPNTPPAQSKEQTVEARPNPSTPSQEEEHEQPRQPAPENNQTEARPGKTVPVDADAPHEAESSVEEKPKPAQKPQANEQPKAQEQPKANEQQKPQEKPKPQEQAKAQEQKKTQDQAKPDDQKKSEDNAK